MKDSRDSSEAHRGIWLRGGEGLWAEHAPSATLLSTTSPKSVPPCSMLWLNALYVEPPLIPVPIWSEHLESLEYLSRNMWNMSTVFTHFYNLFNNTWSLSVRKREWKHPMCLPEAHKYQIILRRSPAEDFQRFTAAEHLKWHQFNFLFAASRRTWNINSGRHFVVDEV